MQEDDFAVVSTPNIENKKVTRNSWTLVQVVEVFEEVIQGLIDVIVWEMAADSDVVVLILNFNISLSTVRILDVISVLYFHNWMVAIL